MKHVEENDKDHYEVIYEQYWTHARHQETQRLSFTQVYSVVVAAILAFLTTQKELTVSLESLLYGFLLLLTILGYFIVYSNNIPFIIFSRLTEQIAVCQWSIPQQYLRWFTELPVRKKKRVFAGHIFIVFYSLMAGIFAAMLGELIICMLSTDQIVRVAVIGSSFLDAFAVLIIVYWHFLRGDATQIIKEIQKEIEKCRGSSP